MIRNSITIKDLHYSPPALPARSHARRQLSKHARLRRKLPVAIMCGNITIFHRLHDFATPAHHLE